MVDRINEVEGTSSGNFEPKIEKKPSQTDLSTQRVSRKSLNLDNANDQISKHEVEKAPSTVSNDHSNIPTKKMIHSVQRPKSIKHTNRKYALTDARNTPKQITESLKLTENASELLKELDDITKISPKFYEFMRAHGIKTKDSGALSGSPVQAQIAIQNYLSIISEATPFTIQKIKSRLMPAATSNNPESSLINFFYSKKQKKAANAATEFRSLYSYSNTWSLFRDSAKFRFDTLFTKAFKPLLDILSSSTPEKAQKLKKIESVKDPDNELTTTLILLRTLTEIYHQSKELQLVKSLADKGFLIGISAKDENNLEYKDIFWELEKTVSQAEHEEIKKFIQNQSIENLLIKATKLSESEYKIHIKFPGEMTLFKTSYKWRQIYNDKYPPPTNIY